MGTSAGGTCIKAMFEQITTPLARNPLAIKKKKHNGSTLKGNDVAIMFAIVKYNSSPNMPFHKETTAK